MLSKYGGLIKFFTNALKAHAIRPYVSFVENDICPLGRTRFGQALRFKFYSTSMVRSY
jgi:hypothetical protein